MFKEIREKYGEEYLLRQLAEECNELGQAALKLIRAWHKETPMRPDEAIEHLIEEIADVQIMLDGTEKAILTEYQLGCVEDMRVKKMQRMRERMLEGKMEEDVW